ncbi:MAG TPA: hypothetical protein VNX88_25180 [Terriglobales bacterium]|jgi:hypothetical protein|nr:hypothetical protein [Terriglobales bacterium]
MIDPAVRTSLINRFPEYLVGELIECYVEQKKNFYLGRMRPNEVEGGRFAEAAFRMLQHAGGLPVTPLGTQLDTDGIIRNLSNLASTSASDSIRLHIPRTLRVIYDIRNKRDAAHLADGIDPNLQDSSFVSAAMDWVLAEFVRLAHGVSPDRAFALVKAITVRRVPAVEQFGDFLKTLRPSLGPSDRILLLLYHCADSGATPAELSGWLKPTQRRNLTRTLAQLEHDKDYIVCTNGKYRLTRRGISGIESRHLVEIE